MNGRDIPIYIYEENYGKLSRLLRTLGHATMVSGKASMCSFCCYWHKHHLFSVAGMILEVVAHWPVDIRRYSPIIGGTSPTTSARNPHSITQSRGSLPLLPGVKLLDYIAPRIMCRLPRLNEAIKQLLIEVLINTGIFMKHLLAGSTEVQAFCDSRVFSKERDWHVAVM